MNLNHIDLDESSWAQSLFRRIKFVKKFALTGKVPIPKALCKELEKADLHSIVRKIEENEVPLSLVLSLEQTPWKYIPVSNKTMPAKGWKNVPIKGSTDKRMITPHLPLPLPDIFCICSLSMQLKQRNASQECSFIHPFHLASTQSTTAIKKGQLKC